MTVYIDDAYIKARVGRINGQWCHMTADTEEELHEFAERIGMKQSWFQNAGRASFHYDVTKGRRAAAVKAGAVEISWREFGKIILERAGRV